MSEQTKGVSSSVSALFVYLMIALFTFFSLLLVLIGAGAHQSVVRDGEQTTRVRASLSYISSKVRAGDRRGAVRVEEYEGVSVLILSENVEEEALQTWIYGLPGDGDEGPGLYELFFADGEEPDLEDGQRIADIEAFEVREANGGIELSVTVSQGDVQSLRLRLRSAQ